MRQFLLAGNVAYSTAADLNAVAAGAIGVFYNDNGQLKVTATGQEVKREAMLVLGRAADKGGPVVLPIFKNNFSYVKGDYVAATKFSAEMDIAAPTLIGDYTIIIAKKGVKFNERNKWSATVHVRDIANTTSDKLSQALVDAINANSEGSGVTAVAETNKLTINAINAGDDYEILGADLYFGVTIRVKTQGAPAYGDAAYVTDLANKAAADAGFEYTYRDDVDYLYPNYPLNPLKQADAADTGFTIFTIRFAEPRDVKTRDEVVNQIIQVAFPTGAAPISTFETVLKALAGEAAEADGQDADGE